MSYFAHFSQVLYVLCLLPFAPSFHCPTYHLFSPKTHESYFSSPFSPVPWVPLLLPLPPSHLSPNSFPSPPNLLNPYFPLSSPKSHFFLPKVTWVLILSPLPKVSWILLSPLSPSPLRSTSPTSHPSLLNPTSPPSSPKSAESYFFSFFPPPSPLSTTYPPSSPSPLIPTSSSSQSQGLLLLSQVPSPTCGWRWPTSSCAHISPPSSSPPLGTNLTGVAAVSSDPPREVLDQDYLDPSSRRSCPRSHH